MSNTGKGTPREIAGAGKPPTANDEAALRAYYASGTPTPEHWTADAEDQWDWDDSGIRDSSGRVVIGVDHEFFTADAPTLAFALRAMNSHAALLAALKAIAGIGRDDTPACIIIAKAAIALAEGGAK